jgi:hypothetical protein
VAAILFFRLNVRMMIWRSSRRPMPSIRTQKYFSNNKYRKFPLGRLTSDCKGFPPDSHPWPFSSPEELGFRPGFCVRQLPLGAASKAMVIREAGPWNGMVQCNT